MKTLILAAGKSKRLKPIEDKNLMPFLGKPLAEHQLETLQNAGFGDFIFICGEHNHKEFQALKKKMHLSMPIIIQEDLSLGMAGAVMQASPYIGKEPILIVSSNDIVDGKIFETLKTEYKKKDADGFMVARHVNEYFPGGYLKLNKRGFIEKIIEKPGEGNEPSKLVNIVIHFYKNAQDLVKYLKNAKSNRDDLYETAVSNMARDGFRIKAIRHDGFWQALKYPWHVLELWKFLLENALGKKSKIGVATQIISKKAEISKYAIIKGNVIIEDGVRVLEHAIINGPCYIGKNTLIANYAMVRDSHIGENCVIGKSTEVARSYVGNGVWMHSNYVGDSVIGDGTSFGAGAITGNLRLDEKNIPVKINGEKVDSQRNKLGVITGKNVRVGINASIMPGVKIGNNSFIGSGIVLAENIDDNKFVTGKWELKIAENKAELNKSAREEMAKKLK
ncbi:MAG: sugar phosphate nucleotidyltransferase [Candidatus Gracilibacteria bacterium]|jgi:bifunctional UDP-N-acetylglucosamine pyrophosphorylase/glucosamine-1-phosphate N-acetyltransferase